MRSFSKRLWSGLAVTALASLATAREGLQLGLEEACGVALDHRLLQSSTSASVTGPVTAGGEQEGFRTDLGATCSLDEYWGLSAAHAYDAIDFVLPGAQQAPPTTGDLHTLHFGAGWRGDWAGGVLSVALAPAVSASSNLMKSPRQWRRNTLQWWANAWYARPAGQFEWITGVAHDYRFGEGRAYPLLGLRWHDPATRLWLTYPDLELTRKLGERWVISLVTRPDGNCWQVSEDDPDDPRDLVQEGWESEMRLSRRWRRFEAGFSIGYRWHQRWSFRQPGAVKVRLETGDAATLGVHLRWLAGGD